MSSPSPVLPGLAPIVAAVLRRSIRTHLPALAP